MLTKPTSKRLKHEFSAYQITQNMLMSLGQNTHYVSSNVANMVIFIESK